MLDRMVFMFRPCIILLWYSLCMILMTLHCMFQGNDMDSSRGMLSGTMDKFKMVWKIVCISTYNSSSISVFNCFMYIYLFSVIISSLLLIFHLRSLRKNLARECLHWWHLLWSFSSLYTISLGNESLMNCIKLPRLCWSWKDLTFLFVITIIIWLLDVR